MSSSAAASACECRVGSQPPDGALSLAPCLCTSAKLTSNPLDLYLESCRLAGGGHDLSQVRGLGIRRRQPGAAAQLRILCAGQAWAANLLQLCLWCYRHGRNAAEAALRAAGCVHACVHARQQPSLLPALFNTTPPSHCNPSSSQVCQPVRRYGAGCTQGAAEGQGQGP